jgi:hypothetical protein
VRTAGDVWQSCCVLQTHLLQLASVSLHEWQAVLQWHLTPTLLRCICICSKQRWCSQCGSMMLSCGQQLWPVLKTCSPVYPWKQSSRHGLLLRSFDLMSYCCADVCATLVPAAYAPHRNVAGDPCVSLSNVSLVIPPLEAAQLAAAAAAAVQAAAGKPEQAVLSLVYPTTAGPLPVVYRSLVVADNAAIAGEHGAAAAADSHRRLLSDGAGQQTICVGSLQGLGLTGRNVCMIAAHDDFPLPPGYIWPGAASGSSSSRSIIIISSSGPWPAWQQALVALAVALPALAAALLGAMCEQVQEAAAAADQAPAGSGREAALKTRLVRPWGWRVWLWWQRSQFRQPQQREFESVLCCACAAHAGVVPWGPAEQLCSDHSIACTLPGFQQQQRRW